MNHEQAELAIEWLQKYLADEHIVTCGSGSEPDCIMEFVSYAVAHQLIVDRSLARIADEIAKCANTIEGYHHFRDGQDGWYAIKKLEKIAEELRAK